MDTDDEVQAEEEQPWEPHTERHAQVNIAHAGEHVKYGLREVEEFFPGMGFYYEESDGFTYSVKKTERGGWEKAGDRYRGRRHSSREPHPQACDPQIVRPNPTRMDDLPMKPVPASPHARTQTHAPQLSTAQRHRNQAGQPRETDGKYAEKPGSKWKQHLGGVPAPRTSLKKVSKPARPTARQPAPRPKSKKTRALPRVQKMMDRPLHEKVVWVVRRWVRRKKKHLRALFSWKG